MLHLHYRGVGDVGLRPHQGVIAPPPPRPGGPLGGGCDLGVGMPFETGAVLVFFFGRGCVSFLGEGDGSIDESSHSRIKSFATRVAGWSLGLGFGFGGWGDVVALLFPSLPSFLSSPTTPTHPCPKLPVTRSCVPHLTQSGPIPCPELLGHLPHVRANPTLLPRLQPL